MHICPVHHPTQIQTLGRQYYQQTFRSRHDSTHNEHMGITPDHCTQKGTRSKTRRYQKAATGKDARLRLVCYYRKLNQKLPADFWSYDKEGQRIANQGINAPYPLPHIDEMFASIRGHKFLKTLDCTGAFHGLKLSPDAAKKVHL